MAGLVPAVTNEGRGRGQLGAEFDPTADAPKPRVRLPLKFEEVLVAAGMAAIALITAANVVVRYLTNISFAFTEEYSVVLMVVVTILGTSLAMAGGRHIQIEYFTSLMSPLAAASRRSSR